MNETKTQGGHPSGGGKESFVSSKRGGRNSAIGGQNLNNKKNDSMQIGRKGGEGFSGRKERKAPRRNEADKSGPMRGRLSGEKR